MSLVWLIMSKALVRSIAMVDVQSRGQSRMSPRTILCAGCSRTDTVEWLGWKSCWLGERENKLSSGCRIRFRTLTAGHRKEMGR